MSLLLKSTLTSSISRRIAITSTTSNSTKSFHSSIPSTIHHLNATTAQYHLSLSQADAQKVILVDMKASWCGPCKILTPLLKSIIPSTSTTIDLLIIDTEEEMELAGKLGIRAMPTVLAYRGGELIGKFVGARNENGVRAFLQEIGAKV